MLWYHVKRERDWEKKKEQDELYNGRRQQLQEAREKKKEREPFQLRIRKKTVYALNPTTDIDYQKQKKKHLPRTSIVF